MRNELKRIISVSSTITLSIASLIGLPIKAQSLEPQLIEEPKQEVQRVHVWNKFTLKAYTKAYVSETYPKWGRGEWTALSKLWGKESAWNHEAANPHSTAYGVAQVLKTKPDTPAPQQVARGLSYIVHRYDKPSVAWSHWRKNGWY